MGKKKVDVSLIIMILAIVAVLVLGGFAIAPKVKTAIDNKKAEKVAELVKNGQATIEDYAPLYSGMSADEFISTYGLKGKVTKDSLVTEAEEKMTLKNFWSYIAKSMGATEYEYSDENLEAFKTFYDGIMAEAEGEEKVEITSDTTDQTVKSYVYRYISQMQSEAMNGPVEVNPETGETEVPTEGGDTAEPVTEPTTEATAEPAADAE